MEDIDLAAVPATRTRVMLNRSTGQPVNRSTGQPVNRSTGSRAALVTAAGRIGLARMEFVINNAVRVHPMALLHLDRLTDEAEKARTAELTRGHGERSDYFVDRLALGLARIAAAGHPDPVIVRLSDFKTNEYANLLGAATTRLCRA